MAFPFSFIAVVLVSTLASAQNGGAAEDPYEAIRRHGQEMRDAEAKERAATEALQSSGADVMRRSQEIQAEQKRAFEAAVEEAAKPTNIMLTAYREYLLARQCFESRTGFEAIYLTAEQMEEAKKQAKNIEAALVAKEPSLDVEERWAEANREETAANGDLNELVYTGRGNIKERTYTEQARRLCAAAAGWLRETYGNLYPESRTVKKDF